VFPKAKEPSHEFSHDHDFRLLPNSHDAPSVYPYSKMTEPMASSEQVRHYLAYWFQLGKPVIVEGGNETVHPGRVLAGDRYSSEFEECWQRILAVGPYRCYLQGTEQTISELLSPGWDFHDCARCSMPLPIRPLGMPAQSCPCADLENWPNTEVPAPHGPRDLTGRLTQIYNRILQVKSQSPKFSDTPLSDS